MICISPFDNGSYHIGTIRTNRTNRQLRQASLSIQRVGNILSPPNEMHFSIRQRVQSESTIRQQLHSFFTIRIYSGVLNNPRVNSCQVKAAIIRLQKSVGGIHVPQALKQRCWFYRRFEVITWESFNSIVWLVWQAFPEKAKFSFFTKKDFFLERL